MSTETIQTRAQRLIPLVRELYDHACTYEAEHASELQAIQLAMQNSARNFLHYLALRQHDLRLLQMELSGLGLSSLGRLEAHTLVALEAVLVALHRLADLLPPQLERVPPVTFQTGPTFLHQHSQQLMGIPAGKRSVRIMVTMPSEAATNADLVTNLLAAGMDIMRINCAHDGPTEWLRMIDNLRQAERKLGRPCKVYADLAGPKLRTGRLAPVGNLLKVKPQRDIRGQTIQPARLWLIPEGGSGDCPTPNTPVVPLNAELFAQLQVGDHLQFSDTRQRRRQLTITSQTTTGCLAQSERTCYLEQGLAVELQRGHKNIAKGRLGALPPVMLPLSLAIGDTLLLVADDQLGHPAHRDATGAVLRPAQIPVTLPEIFQAVQPDERIWFDDGKIGGRVLSNDGQQIAVEITQTRARGAKLGADKGINLPDTQLPIPALTAKDYEDLATLARKIDIVGLSFVRSAEDVTMLQHALLDLPAANVGVVIKIETQQAFENLPRILLASLGTNRPVGMMVARGDLAVEAGFERLAELQEEILWLSEAAHVPVIWATQVLEGMAKEGIPSRAEVSDAVMSGRAECVMLNKGPYIVPAVHLLNNVLERMAAHQDKKRSMLRRLAISQVK